MLKALAISLLSFLLSFHLTPKAAEAARRYGVLDIPDGKLKRHSQPVPYLGGLSIYLAFLFPLSIVHDLNPEIVAILLASTIILFVGFIDDLAKLSPAAKFIGQLVAVWVLVRAGVHIKIAALPLVLRYILTFFWVLIFTNAFNFVDIMDGLAGSIAFFSCAGFAAISLYFQEANAAMIALALAGSLLGFLLFNLPPARIFMGDTGSLFLGFTVSSLAFIVDYTAVNPLGYLIPVIVLWPVLVEAVFTPSVRLLKGLSPFRGSPDHIPLRLERLLGSREKVLAFAAAVQFLLSSAGFLLARAGRVHVIVFLAFLAFFTFAGLIYLFLRTER